MPRLAAWLAGAMDEWWAAAAKPDPFTVAVVSGDDGRLAAAVLAAGPACGPALRYVLVDPDWEGREPPASAAQLVALEEPAFLYPAADRGYGPSRAGDPADDLYEEEDDVDDPDERRPTRGIGPLATFLTDVPALGDGNGAVVALDWLSRLPYDLFEWGDGGWREVRVAAAGDELVEITLPVDPDVAASLPEPAPASPARWRRRTGAAAWLRSILPTASSGVLAAVEEWSADGLPAPDPAAPDPAAADPAAAAPAAADPPAPDPGTADPAAAPDLDQLRLVRQPTGARPRPVEGTRLSVVTWRLG